MYLRPRSLGWQATSLFISAIIALPMLFILAALFTANDESWQHIRSNLLSGYLLNTFWLMLQVAIYSSVIGVSTAWLTAVTRFPGQRFFSWALMLPLAAPAYIIAYVYTDLLEFSGPVQSAFRALTGLEAGEYSFPEIRSLNGAAIVISLVLYPYVYLLARVAFLQRSATLFDAARTLGATPSKAFWRIALPSARPAIAGGLALVLMETLADFGVVDYFGVPTFSTGIFRTWFALGEKAAAMKLAAMMFFFVIILVFLEKYNRKDVQSSALARDAALNPIQLKSWQGMLAAFTCLLPVLFGSLIPIFILIKLAITKGDPMLGFKFNGFVFNSLKVAIIATCIAVIVAILLSYAQQRSKNKLTQASTQLATLGYALPGAMLAVGLLAPVSQFDRWLAEFFETTFNWRSGLLLTGTITVLVYAYVVRFLTVAFNTTNSGLERIPKIYTQAARSLGAKPWRVIKNIHLPMMYRSIIAASILVFVDTIRELPATLLLRPFNFETLATRAYRLASDERLAEASTACLSIVIIGLIPVLFLNRLSNKSKKKSSKAE